MDSEENQALIKESQLALSPEALSEQKQDKDLQGTNGVVRLID